MVDEKRKAAACTLAPLNSFTFAGLYAPRRLEEEGPEDIGLKFGDEQGWRTRDKKQGGGPEYVVDLVTSETELVPPYEKGKVLKREESRENEYSVNKARASLYLFGCVFYNCCCCFLPSRWIGPWCGNRFFCWWCSCCQIKLRRDRWLWCCHFLCFGIHLGFAIYTGNAATGDMKVELTRIAPNWENRGGDYSYKIVPLDESEQIFYIDTVTMLFFAFSAAMHGVWVFISPWHWSIPYLWKQLDECRCWWRWLEYSFSASLMFVGIAVCTAIRDRNTLISLFMLSFCTMWCGMLTELYSRPHKDPDGTYDYNFWQGEKDIVASKRIDPSVTEAKDTPQAESYDLGFLNAARWKCYFWRMIPHILGCFPYITAWFIIVQNFWDQIGDLCERLQELMPDFVPWIIYGSAGIFSLFTFVQWR